MFQIEVGLLVASAQVLDVLHLTSVFPTTLSGEFMPGVILSVA
jgi:hypothetical protein